MPSVACKEKRDSGRGYPGNQGVSSLGSVGGHDGSEVLMHQGPYEHYAVPVAQGHRYEQLQAHLQPGRLKKRKQRTGQSRTQKTRQEKQEK